MNIIIKPSSELRDNYNAIADICAAEKAPVFLTKNGAAHTVLMDMATYNQREKDWALVERLWAAKEAREAGVKGYTVDEFMQNMREVIASNALAGSVSDGE